MSDFGFAMRAVADLTLRVEALEAAIALEKKARDEAEEVMREQGHAIRSTLLIIERLVNITSHTAAHSED